MKRLPTYLTIVHTIPDDSMVFSLVEKDTPQYYKLIMENYINFVGYLNLADKKVLIRFNDYLNWTNFKGFETMFIPREVYQNRENPISEIIDMVNNEYHVMCFIDKFYISFYNGIYQKIHFSHTVMISGYDKKKKYLYCKDYQNSVFVEFQMTFDEFENSLANYDFFSNDTLWLYGLKVKNDDRFAVDYARCYSEFVQLKHGKDNGNISYGLAALNKSLCSLKQEGQEETGHIDRWAEVANYIRESVLLMLDRSEFLSIQFKEIDTSDIIDSAKKLKIDADLLFFRIIKIAMCKGEINKHVNSYCGILQKIIAEYMVLTDKYINVLELILD